MGGERAQPVREVDERPAGRAEFARRAPEGILDRSGGVASRNPPRPRRIGAVLRRERADAVGYSKNFRPHPVSEVAPGTLARL